MKIIKFALVVGLGILIMSFQNCGNPSLKQNQKNSANNPAFTLQDRVGAEITETELSEEDLKIADTAGVGLDRVDCPKGFETQSSGPGEGGLWRPAAYGDGSDWDVASFGDGSDWDLAEDSRDTCDLAGYYLLQGLIRSGSNCYNVLNPKCIPTGHYHWSPAQDLKRYPCDAGTSGQSITLGSKAECLKTQ